MNDDDILIIEIAEQVQRKFTRKNFEIFLVKKKIYSLEALQTDEDFIGRMYRDFVIEILQSSKNERIVKALFEEGYLSPGLIEELQEAGYELDKRIEKKSGASAEKPNDGDLRASRRATDAKETEPTPGARIFQEDSYRVVFIAADPTDAVRLRLGEEFREIQDQLRRLTERRRINLVGAAWAARPQDMSQILLDHNPHIVHFSGHGTSFGEICLENRDGTVLPVSPDILSRLFSQFRNIIRCVILNACFSRVQAEVINDYVPYVIGMNNSIDDRAAIAFSVGFYQALGAGRMLEDAFEFGRIQIGLQGFGEEDIPELLVKK